MTTAQEDTWKSKERGEEARRVHERDQGQLAAIQSAPKESTKVTTPRAEHDFEGGFGGQEDLEDRYATTSGEH